MFIDSHNHLQAPRFDQYRDTIITEMRRVGIKRCIVNGTAEADWGAVKQLALDYPDFIVPSFGLHPWYLGQRSDGWLHALTALLNDLPFSAIGECGLDRWIKDHNIDLQLSIFRKHLELAVELNRPITIHCLKAWGPLLTALQKSPSLPKRILLHSFSGSLETAKELLKFGARFSFSGYFLHSRKENVRDVFRQLPKDRILLETDAPDMCPPSPDYPLANLNHPANLPDIAHQCAEILDIPVKQFSQNSHHFFNIPKSQS